LTFFPFRAIRSPHFGEGILAVNILKPLIAAALLAIPGAAVAGKAEGVKEKKICRGEGSSASRIAKTRVCRTKAEWEMRDRKPQRDAESAVARSSGSGG
jgi:hypothetical protein